MTTAKPETKTPAPGAIPEFNNRFFIGGLPVIAFWVADRFGPVELAIVLSFLASVFVFFYVRESGVIRALSVLGFLTVAGSAIVGLAIGSGKAFVAENIVGDFVIVVIGIVSLAIHKPIFGAIVREMVPVVKAAMPTDHRVFVWLTVVFLGTNVLTGVARIFLLMNLSASEYIIVSRLITWPINVVFFSLTYILIARAMREAGATGAPPEPVPAGN